MAMQPATTLQDLHKQASQLSQLLTFTEVCNLLRKSRSGVYKLMAADPTFPRAIKDGEARSARAFFVAEEVAAWQQSKLAARGAA
ncbi:helix-turn-helix transcriptional regulator [Azotobacter beijerinckii]|uniref:helix-turn-helix transcriptional regulator n=1 Tax=Azotobacter beijerinckii TaxID=170623 RepID=UPI002953674C|nr:AlpA family phage regulatory protein [Azotobacter beijerinckii]MDV7212925.1 AlpA family phage regulatory protein [Azotobacter beijerinckii]